MSSFSDEVLVPAGVRVPRLPGVNYTPAPITHDRPVTKSQGAPKAASATKHPIQPQHVRMYGAPGTPGASIASRKGENGPTTPRPSMRVPAFGALIRSSPNGLLAELTLQRVTSRSAGLEPALSPHDTSRRIGFAREAIPGVDDFLAMVESELSRLTKRPRERLAESGTDVVAVWKGSKGGHEDVFDRLKEGFETVKERLAEAGIGPPLHGGGGALSED